MNVWYCGCNSFYTGENKDFVFTTKPPRSDCHEMGGCHYVELVEPAMSHADAQRHLLSVEHYARAAAGEWDNRYIVAHLTEVSLYARMALTQLDYARLAEEDKTRQSPAPYSGETISWALDEEPHWWADYEKYMFGGDDAE